MRSMRLSRRPVWLVPAGTASWRRSMSWWQCGLLRRRDWRLERRRRGDVLTCEVIDHGSGMERMVVRMPSPDAVGGRGLWLAQRLTGALTVTRRRDGLTAAVSVSVAPVHSQWQS
jgi:hypothetical protein